MKRMIELFTFPKKFDNWPDPISHGKAKILFHRIDSSVTIIHTWINAQFLYDGSIHLFAPKFPSIPSGIYRIPAMLFFENDKERHFLAVSNPYDYTLNEVMYTGVNLYDAPPEIVEREIKKWENSIAIGAPGDVKTIKYAEAHFICSDCLITTPVKVGPAELYPLSNAGVIDLSSSIKEAMLLGGFRDFPLDDIASQISQQADRRSPLFCMSFRRIYRDDESLVLPLLPYIKRVFGILCINRGSYAKLGGCIYFKQKDGRKDIYYINLNSYYRGNLFGGSLSMEKPDVWNEQYELSLENSFKAEIMNKLNTAHAETDLDIAYFRLWSILESISNFLLHDKHLEAIKNLVRATFYPQDIDKAIHLKIGEQKFTSNELFSMWLSWRDCTAHHGGIYAYYAGIKKVHSQLKRMIEEMEKLNLPIEFGEDRSFMLLRDICTKVVEAFISNKIQF